MITLPEALVSNVKNVGQFLSKESPSLLAGLAIGGVILTGACAIRDTIKAIRLIDEEIYIRETTCRYEHKKGSDHEAEPEPLTNKDIVKLVWKCYIPTGISAIVTIGCIIGGNSISMRRNAALAGLYSITQESLREYQEKVVEVLGKGKDRKVMDEIAQDKLREHPISMAEVINTGKGETLFFDTLSSRYFRSDLETVKRVQNEFNHAILNCDSYKTLNELYLDLGLTSCDLGKAIGWDINSILEIIFTSKITEDDLPCIVMTFRPLPHTL